MRNRCLILILLVGLSASPFLMAETAPDTERTVRAFVDAYNDRDIDTMLSECTDDVRWFSIKGDLISIESSGAAELRASLARDFVSGLVARSSILSLQTSGSQVSLVEEASWGSSGDMQSQCSTVVYAFRGSKIRDVWYFQSHQCATDSTRPRADESPE